MEGLQLVSHAWYLNPSRHSQSTPVSGSTRAVVTPLGDLTGRRCAGGLVNLKEMQLQVPHNLHKLTSQALLDGVEPLFNARLELLADATRELAPEKLLVPDKLVVWRRGRPGFSASCILIVWPLQSATSSTSDSLGHKELTWARNGPGIDIWEQDEVHLVPLLRFRHVLVLLLAAAEKLFLGSVDTIGPGTLSLAAPLGTSNVLIFLPVIVEYLVASGTADGQGVALVEMLPGVGWYF